MLDFDYKSLPEVVKTLLCEEELRKNINTDVEITEITDFYKSDRDFADALDEEVFNESGYYRVIREHGFGGSDYDNIDHVYLEIKNNAIYLSGRFNCYVYDGEESKFNAMHDALCNYAYENFNISAVTDAATDKELKINLDVFKYHNNVHWINIYFTLTYKV